MVLNISARREIIAADGKIAKIHRASTEEYREQLYRKFREEVEEFLADDNPKELADILEVLHAITALHNLTPSHIEGLRQKKAQEQGGFEGRIILEEVVEA